MPLPSKRDRTGNARTCPGYGSSTLGKPTPSMCVDAPKFPVAPFDSDSKDRLAATIRVYPSPLASAEPSGTVREERAIKARTSGYNRDKNRAVRKHTYRKSRNNVHVSIQTKRVSEIRIPFCGKWGIRTPGTGNPVRQFSKLLVSATHPTFLPYKELGSTEAQN